MYSKDYLSVKFDAMFIELTVRQILLTSLIR